MTLYAEALAARKKGDLKAAEEILLHIRALDRDFNRRKNPWS